MATIEILQQSQINGSLQFVSTNSVGPQITITLPSVLISPTKAIGMIADAWGELELDGEVLVDIATGSFGQMTTPDGLSSPDVDNYYIGKGLVSWKGVNDGTFRDIGNVSKFEFTPEVKRLDHWSSRTGTKTKDKSVVVEKSAKVLLVMDEWTAENLRLVLMGT
jgi:hypothetical protein